MFKMSVPSLKSALKKEQIFAPCIYDCISLRAAEVCGYKAALLSGGALAESMLGLPDMAFLNIEELVAATQRICACASIPIIVDGDDGYGESPAVVYHNVQRLIQAGASAITIEDSTGMRGWERLVQNNWSQQNDLVSEELWLAKIKAAVEACKDTDCMIIARTAAKYTFGLTEAIKRCQKAKAIGADMVLIVGIKTLSDCQQIGNHISGWKMYPDVMAKNNIPDVELKDIEPYGFQLVTMHYMEKGAMWGMLEYGVNNLKNQSTVYSESHDMNGYIELSKKRSAAPILEFEEMCQKAGIDCSKN